MKRYVMLYTFTFLAVSVVAIWGKFTRDAIVPVSVVKVSPLTVENSVTCSGRVERVATHSVHAPSEAVIRQVYVKVGDKVSVGQTLMKIKVLSSKTGTGNHRSLTNQYSYQSPNKVKRQLITTPYAGRVKSLSVTNKSYVKSGHPVAVIADSLNKFQVRLSVNESQIAEIKTGQRAIITGVGFKTHFYLGTVKSISSDAKQVISKNGQETVVEVIVNLKNSGSDIKAGYTARAKIITSEDLKVLIAPYEAVEADENGNEHVFKLNGKRAVETPIVTNKEFDIGFEVTSGLSENDEIIVNPDTVSNGTYVVPKEKGTLNFDG